MPTQNVLRLALIIVAFSGVSPRAATAAFCGDNVGGRDVPCACGDIVVSNLVLGDDPVATSTCKSDALLIDARAQSPGLVIDLHGLTLRGSGRGAGIWVLHGGTGGARLTSSNGVATIEGFQDGIVARGKNGVVLVENMHVNGVGRDGIRIQGDDYMIRASEVTAAGRDGFALSGQRYAIEGTRALRSKRFGYMGMGVDGRFGSPNSGNDAIENGKAGFNVMGNNHHLASCTARANGADGFHLMGTGFEVASCVAETNKQDGISGSGSNWWLGANSGVANGNNGIDVHGMGMTDGGRNHGDGNRGVRRTTAIQCEIGGKSCQQLVSKNEPR